MADGREPGGDPPKARDRELRRRRRLRPARRDARAARRDPPRARRWAPHARRPRRGQGWGRHAVHHARSARGPRRVVRRLGNRRRRRRRPAVAPPAGRHEARGHARARVGPARRRRAPRCVALKGDVHGVPRRGCEVRAARGQPRPQRASAHRAPVPQPGMAGGRRRRAQGVPVFARGRRGCRGVLRLRRAKSRRRRRLWRRGDESARRDIRDIRVLRLSVGPEGRRRGRAGRRHAPRARRDLRRSPSCREEARAPDGCRAAGRSARAVQVRRARAARGAGGGQRKVRGDSVVLPRRGSGGRAPGGARDRRGARGAGGEDQKGNREHDAQVRRRRGERSRARVAQRRVVVSGDEHRDALRNERRKHERRRQRKRRLAAGLPGASPRCAAVRGSVGSRRRRRRLRADAGGARAASRRRARVGVLGGGGVSDPRGSPRRDPRAAGAGPSRRGPRGSPAGRGHGRCRGDAGKKTVARAGGSRRDASRRDAGGERVRRRVSASGGAGSNDRRRRRRARNRNRNRNRNRTRTRDEREREGLRRRGWYVLVVSDDVVLDAPGGASARRGRGAAGRGLARRRRLGRLRRDALGPRRARGRAPDAHAARAGRTELPGHARLGHAAAERRRGDPGRATRRDGARRARRRARRRLFCARFHVSRRRGPRRAAAHRARRGRFRAHGAVPARAHRVLGGAHDGVAAGARRRPPRVRRPRRGRLRVAIRRDTETHPKSHRVGA